jgi:hypothetical protein
MLPDLSAGRQDDAQGRASYWGDDLLGEHL